MAYNEWTPIAPIYVSPGQSSILREVRRYLKHPIGITLSTQTDDSRLLRFEIIGNDLRYTVGDAAHNSTIRAEILADRVVNGENRCSPILIDFEVRIPSYSLLVEAIRCRQLKPAARVELESNRRCMSIRRPVGDTGRP